ncbi:hypothetical protein NsoK4_00350 [Nitrosopumilus sp. K4]|uniref:hypothetical protein n=1 Tax=Nitrosopumilus sp. K4 TaxID=2795383 RepID=UPI001BADBD3D|nr:hypothetical protein [Nitrosopumilus sp. K4]QUC65594.1 hypothetical protein NsoK4_00350 [Nitrosopumilus sp. K4]
MKKSSIVGISGGIGITIIILGIIFATSQDSGSMEVEDVLDRELRPEEEITPEVQEKLDEIEKIVDENEYSPAPREWITSGPFQIDRSKYVLGEKIFLVIGGLDYQEKGQVAFLRPLNDTHYSVYQTIPFDGAKKNVFNYYISPQLSKTRGICSADDIIGNWTVVFRGTDYPNLKFEITDQILPGDEDSYTKPVC